MARSNEKFSAQGVRVAECIPLSGVRKMVAEHMTHSHVTVPAVTILEEWNVQAMVDLRTQLLQSSESGAPGVSYTHIMIKAIAQALQQHRFLNATLAANEIQLLEEINIGVAVALPDGNLVVPVIRAADQKSIVDIATEARLLADQARSGKLRLSDVRAATFTLTNVGMIADSRWQTPLVPTSQCAILATGAIREAPVVRNGAIVVGRVMSASLTFDHRIVSGVPAGLFLKTLGALLEGGVLI
jgi:pyruvate/2-oxoglutarate dehydrogenase complex dihydrolipoamide acyltransferase (E2) component